MIKKYKNLEFELDLKTWCLPIAIGFNSNRFIVGLLCIALIYNFKK